MSRPSTPAIRTIRTFLLVFLMVLGMFFSGRCQNGDTPQVINVQINDQGVVEQRPVYQEERWQGPGRGQQGQVGQDQMGQGQAQGQEVRQQNQAGQAGASTSSTTSTMTGQPQPQPQGQPQPPQQPEQIVLSVGQIFPGQIDISRSKQSMHYISITKLQKKYLFIRLNTYDKVRMAIGLYSNATRKLISSCEDNLFDSCYVPSRLLEPDTVYAILVIVSDSIKYNLYTYWGDLQHLKPNQQMKFMFDDTNPTQLFHLEFGQQKDFQQIRLVLKPETSRTQGDNVRIYANLGFKAEPTATEYEYTSVHVWGDAQAIILNKDQLKGETGIGIYIVGNAETVYILECQFLKHTSHSLKVGEIVNDYLQKGHESIYRLQLGHALTPNQTYVIKVSSFTGQIFAEYFYDKQLKNPYQKSPYQYMSDVQYNFDAGDLKDGTKELFMRVKAQDAQATYQISTQLRGKELAYEITENIYEFTIISQQKQAMYFYSHIWDTSQFEQLKTYRFDISMIKITGEIELEYFLCKNGSKEQECTDINAATWPAKVEKMGNISVQEVGAKSITTIEAKQEDFININNVEKRLMVIIVITNKNKNKNKNEIAAVAIEYSNPNQIRLLREGRAFEDKVRYQQKKYYKYINNNPKISEIRIHINQISGLTKIRAKRSNFHLDQSGPQFTVHKDLPDTITIKQNITEPIYIEIHGVVSSLYTISVTAIHTEHLISNSLIMAQDIEYEVKLLPYQHMNIELHPIEANIVFEYYVEGGTVMICEVDAKDLCKMEKTVGSHGELKIDASSSREVRLRIGNYIDTNKVNGVEDSSKSATTPPNMPIINDEKLPTTINKVKLTLIYHGAGQTHCDQRRINKVYSQSVKSGTCFKYHLPIAADFEIMVARSDLGETLRIFLLCNKKFQPVMNNNRYIVKTNQIQQSCRDPSQQLSLTLVLSDSNYNSQLKMEYCVEYGNDTVTLADGVAYLADGFSAPETALRTFFYEIIDEDREIGVVMYNKKGIQKFYGKIVGRDERYFGAVPEGQAEYNSKSSNYYTNPYIKITPENIAKANCGRTCILVLSVYSTEKTGTEIQYALEVTQNHIFLKQDQIKVEFLAKGSVRFYEYESKSGKGTLLFKVSDHNRKCARSIMSKNPFPTSSNYYVKQNQGTILYEKTEKNTLYFAVEAIEDCPYTVSVSEGDAKITKIQYGQFYDLKLEEGKQKWFYMQHVSNSTFKIVSMKKYGEIYIAANRSQLGKEDLQKIQYGKMDSKQFTFRSSYKNTLVVKSTEKEFCYNCYYLICIHATTMTEASIFLGSENSKIALSEQKILFDEIQNKNAITMATFYRVSDGKLQVRVHSGKINMEMSYSSQKFVKSFAKNRKVYHQEYNFTKQEGTYAPIEIRITAEKVPALYSFELEPTSDSKSFTHKINPGEHTFVYLDKGAQQCFSGVLTSKEDQVYISSDVAEKYVLSGLNITIKIDDNVTENYRKEVVGNILSLRFNIEQTFMAKPKKYHICMQTQAKNQSLSLFVFQNKDVNLIHSDTQVLVRKQGKFVLYPRNDIILDVFECQGSAQIYYGNNLQNIRGKQSHKLDVIGIPGQSHAIRITEFSTLYIDVLAEMATVLWMPLVEKEERGVGYFRYAIGGLEFASKFNSIEFRVGGVYRIKETKTQVVNVKYTLFVANSKEILQQAVMCEKNVKSKLVSTTINTGLVGANSSHTISVLMDKKRITDEFFENETLYFNVVADLTLKPPENITEDDHEHYRFIYYQQVVPSEVFRQNKIESLQLTLLIVLAVVSVLGFVLISCIFVRCVVPALGRLKNRVLVEEKEDPRDQSVPVPQSSERAQRVEVQGPTEEEMKS